MPGNETIQDEAIAAILLDNYNLVLTHLVPILLSADQHSRVFQVDTPDGKSYFVKLRSGGFNPISVLLPNHLDKQGIEAIIPSIATKDNKLWVETRDFRLILYPHIRGLSAAEQPEAADSLARLCPDLASHCSRTSSRGRNFRSGRSNRPGTGRTAYQGTRHHPEPDQPS